MIDEPGGESNLLRHARDGDPIAFVALLRRHEPRLRALAYRVLRNPDLVSDAMQETALRAFRSLGTFRDESSLGTWLYRIAYTSCLDLLERDNRQSRLIDRSRPACEVREPDPSESITTLDQLSQALDALSPEHRAVVYLVLQQDLDLATAAKILGIPYGTVGSRLNHARKVLRRALTGEEVRR